MTLDANSSKKRQETHGPNVNHELRDEDVLPTNEEDQDQMSPRHEQSYLTIGEQHVACLLRRPVILQPLSIRRGGSPQAPHASHDDLQVHWRHGCLPDAPSSHAGQRISQHWIRATMALLAAEGRLVPPVDGIEFLINDGPATYYKSCTSKFGSLEVVSGQGQ